MTGNNRFLKGKKKNFSSRIQMQTCFLLRIDKAMNSLATSNPFLPLASVGLSLPMVDRPHPMAGKAFLRTDPVQLLRD